MTALAILENPRQTVGKGLVFDGSFYLGLEGRESIVASLRYFNRTDQGFPEVGLYFVYTTVAQMDPSVEVFAGTEPEDRKAEEYSLVGDIQFLFYLGAPDEVDIDYRQRPYLHICGAAFNVDVPTATFSVMAEPYTAAFREMQKANRNATGSVAKSLFATNCIIPDSRRYDNVKKPVPYNKRYVMVTGHLTGVTSKLDDDNIKDFYCINVENIAFLGTQVTAANTAGDSPAPALTPTPAPTNKARKRWSYDTPINNVKRKKVAGSEVGGGDGSSSAGPSSPSPATTS
ncbi:hypothetical protein DFH07DRAFT_968533 [Mycena maculata]|uniref:Uncharacterized protein n=1 Tax=Mycena maculata TaxID=230809 RepID=A0AAD7MT48_9AGAR|nr:hypothetical protein DFH07DRAFT_968533 [Mycena maculata]